MITTSHHSTSLQYTINTTSINSTTILTTTTMSSHLCTFSDQLHKEEEGTASSATILHNQAISIMLINKHTYKRRL